MFAMVVDTLSFRSNDFIFNQISWTNGASVT